MLFSSVERVDSNYHVIGVTVDKGLFTNQDRIIIGTINNEGNLYSYKSLVDSVSKRYSAYLNAFTLNSKGELLYAGLSIDSLPKLLVLRKNIITDSISMYEYSTPNSYAFQGYKIVQQGSFYYVAGAHTDITIGHSNNFLAKIDSNYNRVWQKYYGLGNRMEFARSLIALRNGNLMMGSMRNDFNRTNERSNTWLIEVDTGGTVIRQWLDNSDSTYVAEGLLQTRDGGFIYGAQKKNEQSVNDVYKIATIVKMDSAFNKEWTFTGGVMGNVTGINDIEELPDGNFIAAGNYSNAFGWVVKLNPAGQIVWEKKYKALQDTTPTWNILTDIDVLPDGNLIAVGQGFRLVNPSQLPPQVGWFLKLDSNGCEVENCLVGIEKDDRRQTIDDRQIQLQPNPTNGNVQLTIENDMIGGAISLYSVTGSLVLHQTAEAEKIQLNLAALSKGMYIVTVQKQWQIARGRLVVE